MSRRLAIFLVLLSAPALGLWPLLQPPGVATVDGFDTQRALDDLRVITAAPRVTGSAGYDAALEHLAAELEALGVETDRTDEISVHALPGAASVARARNLVARIPGSDSSGTLVLAGHLDSVHTTPGASDCGGCSVSLVEVARAVMAGPPLRNDLILLIEDGEETSRSGALSFVRNHPWADDLRVAFNLEAMGARGSSILYVTGPDNDWLIRHALRAMPKPVAFSFIDDLVWRSGTGGSDLDQLLLAADTGLGLVYVGRVPVYHTRRDSVDNLDPRTLQHQGGSALALVRHFGMLDLSADGRPPGDAVYFNLVGHHMIRYPARAAGILALIIALLSLTAGAFAWRRQIVSTRGVLLGVLLWPVVSVGATLLCAALWYGLRLLDPRLQVFLIGVSYDRPAYSLAFALLAAGLVLLAYSARRRWTTNSLATGALLWWLVLALASARWLPGSSYLFALTAACGWMMVAARAIPRIAMPVALAGGFVILLIHSPVVAFLGTFSGRAEILTGLPFVAAMPALVVAMLVGPLLPAVALLTDRRRQSATLLLALGVLLLVAIGLRADFDEQRPKPNMVAYLHDAESGTDHWITGAAAIGDQRRSLLDDWTRQFLSDSVEEAHYSPWGATSEDRWPAYRSPAPPTAIEAPGVELRSDRMQAGQRALDLRIASARQAAALIARIQSDGPIDRARVAGESLQPAPADGGSQLTIMLHALDAVDLDLILAPTATLTIHLEDHVYGLPDLPGIQPRPAWMIPSPTFITDATLARRSIRIPARP